MGLFTVGNGIVGASESLTPMLIARFASGLGTSVLAVASSVATQLAGRHRAGAAVSVVLAVLQLRWH